MTHNKSGATISRTTAFVSAFQNENDGYSM